jgi:hypothetical protein
MAEHEPASHAARQQRQVCKGFDRVEVGADQRARIAVQRRPVAVEHVLAPRVDAPLRRHPTVELIASPAVGRGQLAARSRSRA